MFNFEEVVYYNNWLSFLIVYNTLHIGFRNTWEL
jgi:hypothetical protein